MEVLAEVVRRAASNKTDMDIPVFADIDALDARLFADALALDAELGLLHGDCDADARIKAARDDELLCCDELELCRHDGAVVNHPSRFFEMRKLALHLHAPCEETLSHALTILTSGSMYYSSSTAMMEADDFPAIPVYLGLVFARLFEGREGGEGVFQDRIDPLDANDVHASFPSIFDPYYSSLPCRSPNLSRRSCMTFPDLPCIARVPCGSQYLSMFAGYSSVTPVGLRHCLGKEALNAMWSLGVRVTLKAYDCRKRYAASSSSISAPFRIRVLARWACSDDEVFYSHSWDSTLSRLLCAPLWVFETQSDETLMSSLPAPRVVSIRLTEADDTSVLLTRTEDSLSTFTIPGGPGTISISASMMSCNDCAPSSNVARFFHDVFLAKKPVVTPRRNETHRLTVELDRPAVCRLFFYGIFSS